MVDFGRKLRQLREAQGLTQKQVGTRIGVTSSVVSAYENGIRLPSYAALIKLTSLYGVSADYLLGISGIPTRESQHLISLDGLTPTKMALVRQLVEELKE